MSFLAVFAILFTIGLIIVAFAIVNGYSKSNLYNNTTGEVYPLKNDTKPLNVLSVEEKTPEKNSNQIPIKKKDHLTLW